MTDGGVPLPLTFRPSLLNGVPVDIARATEALTLLNRKVLEAA